MQKTKTKNQTSIANPSSNNNQKQLFTDHLNEARQRLLFVALIFIIASTVAYPFYHHIIAILFAPLHGQQLIYLTPIGGFSFIIKVCAYVGIIFAIPALVYHSYKFIQPVVSNRIISARKYYFVSMLLASVGVVFAYYVLLPAAIKFLTNLDIQQVTAMLTVDSYISFVIAYFIGAAIVFQIPIILVIINSINGIQPKTLFKYQKHVLIFAFVFAAVLSPTPDIINQCLMALPILVMYQFSIILILLINRKRKNSNNIYHQSETIHETNYQEVDTTHINDQGASIVNTGSEQSDPYFHRETMFIAAPERIPKATCINRYSAVRKTQSMGGVFFHEKR